jgi:hypothetical protein
MGDEYPMHGSNENTYKIFSVNLKGSGHLEDPGVDANTINSMLKKWSVKLWTGFSWLIIRPSCVFLRAP